MKVGDLIKKVRGDSDLGMTGLVESIQTNSMGNTIATVITHELHGNRSGKREPWAQSNMGGIAARTKNWLAEYCDVISTAEQRLEDEESMWRVWGDQ